ncbi:MAG: SMC family ATPase, partial [Pseudomonadota bacterium]
MRPLKLTISAFGPFTRELTLDFRGLGREAFFLIHGPTGSGKTTILDAMCFALYGVSSGEERDPRQMRSQLAEASEPTEVTFDFALGGEVFRVSRSPEQERPKKRGEGTIIEKPKAVLWSRTGLADDAVEGRVLADRWTTVNDEIEHRLGFKSEQFRQVIMLPQGQFRTLLLARSTERQEILETLFQTEIYRRIEEALKKAAEAEEAKIKETRTRRELILNQAGAESEAELAQRLKEAEAFLTSVRSRLAEFRDKESASQNKLDQARLEAEKIKEKEAAEKALAELEKMRPVFSDKDRTLERARRAAAAAGEDTSRRLRRQEFEQAGLQLAGAEETARQAQASHQKAQADLAAEESRVEERKKEQARVSKREALIPKGQELETLRIKAVEAGREFEQRTQEQELVRKSLEEAEKNLARTRDAQAKAERAADMVESLRLEHDQLVKAVQNSRRLSQVTQQLKEQEKLGQKAERRLGRADKAIKKALVELSEAETAWQSGQAALLAGTLVDGRPCPVCGSMEHPAPAVAELEVPDATAVKEKREQVESRHNERQAAVEAEQAVKQEIKVLQAESSFLLESLGPRSETKTADLEKEAAAKGAGLSEAEQAAARLNDLVKEVERLTREQMEGQEKLKAGEKALAEAEKARERNDAVLADREKEMPEGLRTAADLTVAYGLADQRHLALEQAL